MLADTLAPRLRWRVRVPLQKKLQRRRPADELLLHEMCNQRRRTRIRGEGGSRGERFEARGSPVVGRHEPRLWETEARVVEQRVDDRWQRIEAERGELRLLGRFRPRGSLVRGELAESGLVQLAVHAGGLVSCHGLALVEDLGRRHRPEGNESLRAASMRSGDNPVTTERP